MQFVYAVMFTFRCSVPYMSAHAYVCMFHIISVLQYEILFCVQSVSDPSLKVVQDLRQAYPHVDVSVLTGVCVRACVCACVRDILPDS